MPRPRSPSPAGSTCSTSYTWPAVLDQAEATIFKWLPTGP